MLRLRLLLSDERGSEIAEWVVVVTFVLASGVAAYAGVLLPELNHALDDIGKRILNIASGNPGGS
jgi:branched-subunit amino acid ABC-type transport system permease component